MGAKEMERLLTLHSVECWVKDGRLLALEGYNDVTLMPDGERHIQYKYDWIDVTDWPRAEVMEWLGY